MARQALQERCICDKYRGPHRLQCLEWSPKRGRPSLNPSDPYDGRREGEKRRQRDKGGG